MAKSRHHEGGKSANCRRGQKASRGSGRLTPEAALLGQIGLPEEVELFEEFEELAKTFTIEAPFVSRSQIELMFDVYDGRKLSQSGATGNELSSFDQANSPANLQTGDDQHQAGGNYKLSSAVSELSAPINHQPQRADPDARRSIGGLKAIARRSKRPRANLTWCKLLFVHNLKRQKSSSSSSNKQQKGFKCCLSKSETGQDLWLSPSSSATSLPTSANNNNKNRLNSQVLCDEYLSAALEGSPTDDNNGDNQEEEAELKAEVLQLIGPLLNRLRRNSILMDAEAGCGGASGLANSANLEQQQQQVILDGSVGAAGRISVCLFDKRNRTIRTKVEAENGRRWWKLESILEDLRWRSKLLGGQKQQQQQQQLPSQYHEELDSYFGQRHLSRSSVLSKERCTKSEKLSRDNFDRLVALTKDSLNHLIDAQLLLRNKLANELQQQQQQQLAVNLQPAQQQQCLIAREHEYELLLRQNFNLLKVWQNFEETKRLACFVCEPIKANLQDLFWFSRQRFSSNSSSSRNEDSTSFLSSPLVSLDAIQVKRGLIQILEALHYLHAICKLVHRNVNPSNILIAANDNWKLSGLQFAVRFESATISESASIMASENSNMLRYSAALAGGCGGGGGAGVGQSNTSARLKRQRTLHQTKCEEYSRKPKQAGNGILQPEVDYLAPEIWKSSKCSHKSDLFSYGLILGQTYDLFRHKPPISCRSNLDAYERELKKLVERRKLKLSRQVPLEMREALLATLECEPNLRPSANYAIQLFRRPIELCKTNDDSLRHLRRSLRFLDASCPAATFRLPSSASSAANQKNSNSSHNNLLTATIATATTAAAAAAAATTTTSTSSGANISRGRGHGSYFQKVTSAAANQAPRSRQQSKTLHLLNLLLRGVDSLAQMGQQFNYVSSEDAATDISAASQFSNLRNQFEYTFESLRQLFGAHQGGSCGGGGTCSTWQLCGGAYAEDAGACESAADLGSLFAASKPADQRSLMLIIALHRRLLDQLARIRIELPPVCRLAGANSSLNRPTQRHRALAEMEDKFYCLVSRDSLRKLSPILTDPLLKLDEFLLLYELIGDLFAFVGQKCRQNFLQRGKQLLNELTPVTGCPSSSSSDDDYDEYNNTNIIENLLLNPAEQFQPQQQQFDTCAQAGTRNILLGASRETLNNLTGAPVRLSSTSSSSIHQQANHHHQHQFVSGGLKMAHSGSNRRFSEYPEQANAGLGTSSSSSGAATATATAAAAAMLRQHRASAGDYLLQQPQLPTRISITAPSPMGSLRDVNNNSTSSSSINRFASNQHRDNNSDLCDRTNELSLRGGADDELVEEFASDQNSYSNNNNNNGDADDIDDEGRPDLAYEADNHSNERSRSASDQGVDKMVDKSRSQLIDELLKSINDDSFTADYAFNGNKNKLDQSRQHRAATATSSMAPAASQNPNASQLANMNRPKSAIDGTQTIVTTNQQQQMRRQSNRQPNTTLAFNQQQQQQQRSGTSGAQTTSTFDNVIRRMSTNLVQNFNKMSSNMTTAAADIQQDQTLLASIAAEPSTALTTTTTNQAHQQQQQQATNIRREKSSNYANSLLYVDNQVPARRHSDNTINIPRIQVALSSPQAGNSRFGLNQRASVSASKLANKWKLSAKTNQRESGDKLSPNLSGALGYMRRHSSGNTTGNDQGQSNGQTSSSNLLLNAAASPFKTKSSSNLGLDFLLSNRSMKRRYSAASMLSHQTQRKAENLIDAGMKSVQNMFG